MLILNTHIASASLSSTYFLISEECFSSQVASYRWASAGNDPKSQMADVTKSKRPCYNSQQHDKKIQ